LAVHAEFAHFADTDPWGLNENLFDFGKKIKPRDMLKLIGMALS